MVCLFDIELSLSSKDWHCLCKRSFWDAVRVWAGVICSCASLFAFWIVVLLPWIDCRSSIRVRCIPNVYLIPWIQPCWDIMPFELSSFKIWINGMRMDVIMASGKWIFGILRSYSSGPSKTETVADVIAIYSNNIPVQHTWSEMRLRFSPRKKEASDSAPDE